MKEATLFILKQVLDDFQTSNKAVELEAARVFLDQIRGSLQDCESKPFPIVPFIGACCDREITIIRDHNVK